MNKHTVEMLGRLQKAGISTDDALALRRIAMTLHRWHELECGDSNDYGAWCITRGKMVKHPTEPKRKVFEHDDAGAPYLERHHYRTFGGLTDSTSYTKIPDRERGALWRLEKLRQKYHDSGHSWIHYVQTDPRGASVYIIPHDRIRSDEDVCAEWLSANYTRGIAVYK